MTIYGQSISNIPIPLHTPMRMRQQHVHCIVKYGALLQPSTLHPRLSVCLQLSIKLAHLP